MLVASVRDVQLVLGYTLVSSICHLCDIRSVPYYLRSSEASALDSAVQDLPGGSSWDTANRVVFKVIDTSTCAKCSVYRTVGIIAFLQFKLQKKVFLFKEDTGPNFREAG